MKTSPYVIVGILSGTILLATMFAFIPVQKAATVHTSIIKSAGGQSLNVLTVQKTLPTDGSDVSFTLTTSTDALIEAIWVDNSATTGSQKDFRLVSMTVGGVPFSQQTAPFDFADDDEGELADALARIADLNNSNQLGPIPVDAGQTVAFTFDTDNGDNSVIIELAMAVTGSAGASLV
jgi:hypothetical protein